MRINKSQIVPRAIHSGEPRPRIGKALNLPIFQSSVFETAEVEKARTGLDGRSFPRTSGTLLFPTSVLAIPPNHLAVQQKLAEMEEAEAALVAACGMAAISATLLTDHSL